MTEKDAVRLPPWGRIAIVLAAILLVIVVVTSVDFSSDDEPDRPNLIGFDTTITR